MASSQVRERSRSAAQEYFGGDQAEARRELGELAFEALENVFPEASARRSGQRTGQRVGGGFVMGVLVGATLAVWLLRRLGQNR